MGRKKKRNKKIIFCYYCDRMYENERVLIQHQRAKHFKCPQCHKRISTAQGMMVHMFQVHKETIENVPGAKDGRNSFDVEIFGMDGVPIEVIEEKRMKMFGEPAKKKQKVIPHPPQLPIAQPQSHQIKIPGTRSVFSIAQAGTPAVNQMMMVRIPGMPGMVRMPGVPGMSGMPMYPGMPYPGITQLMPQSMPLQLSTLQLRPTSIPRPGSMALPQMGGRLVLTAPTRITSALPPPKIAPPPVTSLPDFPKLPPPPQFNNISASPPVVHTASTLNEPTSQISQGQAPQPSKSGEQSNKIVLDQSANSTQKDSTHTPKALAPVPESEHPNHVLKSITNQRTPLTSQAAPTNAQLPEPYAQSNSLPVLKATPTGPPVNRFGAGALPGISAPLQTGKSVQLMSTNSPQLIQYRCPPSGTQKGRSPIIPMQSSSTVQLIGRQIRQVIPFRSNSPPSVSPVQSPQAPEKTAPLDKAATLAPLDKAATQKKKKTTILIYNEKNISQEEKRAMHPKYSGHLTNRIASLSESIEERLKALK